MKRCADYFRLIFFFFSFLTFFSCDKEKDAITQTETPSINYDTLKFITVNYIEIDKIKSISKFRSGIGHDYWDDFENCRSLKHYFVPNNGVDWSSIKIFSPITGKVVRINEEWAGTQVQIQTNGAPNFVVIIFHIALLKSLTVGENISAGQQLGTHIGSQTYSDITIGYSKQGKWKLLSYFSAINDSLFNLYKARGANSRSDFIISKEARDADPLNCSGETFGTQGTLENWVNLK